MGQERTEREARSAMQLPPCNRRQFLTGALASAAALTGVACSGRPSYDGPLNFLVYMPDSMRADSLGCYGGPSNCSPVMDELARNSFVFDSCYAQSSWTKPSVGSIFTGMTPRVHKAATTPWRAPEGDSVAPRMLRNQFTTWAESMQALGYRTACFQTNPHPREEFGYDRGFTDFFLEVNQQAAEQAGHVRRWLTENGGEPFFAFVHQIDPHGPYTPYASDFLETHGEPRHRVAEAVSKNDLERMAAWRQAYMPDHADEMTAARRALSDMSTEGIRYLRMLYEAQIRRVDRALASILHQLEAQGLRDRTVVVVTSDHGEAFGEHGVFGHGNTLFLEELHVPLIVHVPNHGRETRVPAPVALYDLYPTCLALAGGQPDSELMAQSLLDDSGTLIVPPDRAIFAELDSPSSDGDLWGKTMIEDGRVTTQMMIHDKPELFMAHDLEADPLQQAPLPPQVLEESNGWQTRIEQFHRRVERHRKIAARLGPPETAVTPESYEEELQALGYV
jgi:arylsulfatase A-like enzyme